MRRSNLTFSLLLIALLACFQSIAFGGWKESRHTSYELISSTHSLNKSSKCFANIEELYLIIRTGNDLDVKLHNGFLAARVYADYTCPKIVKIPEKIYYKNSSGAQRINRNDIIGFVYTDGRTKVVRNNSGSLSFVVGPEILEQKIGLVLPDRVATNSDSQVSITAFRNLRKTITIYHNYVLSDRQRRARNIRAPSSRTDKRVSAEPAVVGIAFGEVGAQRLLKYMR